ERGRREVALRRRVRGTQRCRARALLITAQQEAFGLDQRRVVREWRTGPIPLPELADRGVRIAGLQCCQRGDETISSFRGQPARRSARRGRRWRIGPDRQRSLAETKGEAEPSNQPAHALSLAKATLAQRFGRVTQCLPLRRVVAVDHRRALTI